jgi:prophage regulatory protein
MDQTDTHKLEPLLLLPEVMALTRVSRAGIYAQMAKNMFPAPVKIGLRSVAWKAEEIREWLDNRPRAAYGELNDR